MPLLHKSRREILDAIRSLPSLADLVAVEDGRFRYELDLEVIVYGRNYRGKKVGPYMRLLTFDPGETVIREGAWGGNTFYIVVKGQPEVLLRSVGGEDVKVSEIPPGRHFGEMALLAGVPRSATVKAPDDQPAQVLEIQRPALRLLRKLPGFSESLDNAYFHHGRKSTFQEMDITPALSQWMIDEAGGLSQFRVFSKNHVLFHEGATIDHIYIIKEGWLRRSKRQSSDPESDDRYDFIGGGYCFGLEGIEGMELSLREEAVWPYTATLIGRSEVLMISIAKLRRNPALKDALRKELARFTPPTTVGSEFASEPVINEKKLSAQEKLINTGLVDGTNLLVMDLDLCVRCGRCSMACHKVHGQSRLLRRGIPVTRIEKKLRATIRPTLAPAVCLHCKDPECLTGCPTGAIGRYSSGQIDINAGTCIGCGDCATNCPYNAISMAPRNPASPPVDGNIGGKLRRWLSLRADPLPPPVEQSDDLLAVKCNLCSGTSLNPPDSKTPAYSCEENCPTGALARVNPGKYFTEIEQIRGLAFLDKTHAIGRNIHKSDPPKRLMHLAGVSLALILNAGAIALLNRYGFEEPVLGPFNMRWVTGLVGLIGIAAVMAYAVRRQIFRRRAGPLRYWLLAHYYLGAMGGIMILLHGAANSANSANSASSANSGGLLTTALMMSFDLVILTGLFGIFCYLAIPRLLTRIEGDPLLLDDLLKRQRELRDEITEIVRSSTEPLRRLVTSRVAPRFLSLGYLLRQFLKREDLNSMLESARAEFNQMASELADEQDRQSALKAIGAAATLRRVDALILLHKLLKAWLPPHVMVTALMLALLLVHLIQVIYAW